MGQNCSCLETEGQFVNLPIHLSREHFQQIKQTEISIDEVKSISNNQILDSFTTYKIYKKGSNTYFIGLLQQNHPNNYGILYIPNKTLYYGQIQNGLFNGAGTLILLNHQASYKGQFNQGKPNGKGVLSSQKQQFSFTGFWKQDINIKKTLPISGILKLPRNKNIDQIQFESFEHRNAIIYYKNGSQYTGFIQKLSLLPHGIGKMTFETGDTYQGQWVNGKFQGMGTYIWKNGQRYNGQYFDGLKHGQGNFYYKNKKYYSGVWINGRKCGFGKLMDQHGVVIQKGIYKNDILDQEQTKSYLQNYMQKAPREELKSELIENSLKEDQLIK